MRTRRVGSAPGPEGRDGESRAGRSEGSGEEPASRLRDVRIERGGRALLEELDLDLPAGRVTVLLGPSGSGKTSLLRVLNRLDDPTEGSVLYRGRPVADYPVRELRRLVGFVFQAHVMFDGTVEDNLRVPAELAGWDEAETETRIREALELAETLLLDEPTSALDAVTSRRLLRTFRRLAEGEGRTAVMATHREEEARAVGDRAVLLRDGGVARVGRPGSVL